MSGPENSGAPLGRRGAHWVWFELTPEQREQIRLAIGKEGDTLFMHLEELLSDQFTVPARVAARPAAPAVPPESAMP